MGRNELGSFSAYNVTAFAYKCRFREPTRSTHAAKTRSVPMPHTRLPRARCSHAEQQPNAGTVPIMDERTKQRWRELASSEPYLHSLEADQQKCFSCSEWTETTLTAWCPGAVTSPVNALSRAAAAATFAVCRLGISKALERFRENQVLVANTFFPTATNCFVIGLAQY